SGGSPPQSAHAASEASISGTDATGRGDAAASAIARVSGLNSLDSTKAELIGRPLPTGPSLPELATEVENSSAALVGELRAQLEDGLGVHLADAALRHTQHLADLGQRQ